MISLTQDTLPDYFTIANKETSWLSEPTNLYNFVSHDSDELIVTVGDSWTWGSDISRNDKDDSERVRHLFGNVIAQRRQADWLNLAIPAQGNFYIAEMVQELARIIPTLPYKKIIVICTFTGVGRWFNTRFDLDIDYISWFRQNVQSQNDFDKFLTMLNKRCVDKIISTLKPFDHVVLKIGTNFVDHLGFDNLTDQQKLKDPWYHIMNVVDDRDVYTCIYYNRLSMITEFLDNKFHDDFKRWFLEIYDKSHHRLRLIQNPNKFRNYHPMASGHLAWANYICDQIQS